MKNKNLKKMNKNINITRNNYYYFGLLNLKKSKIMILAGLCVNSSLNNVVLRSRIADDLSMFSYVDLRATNIVNTTHEKRV